MTDEQADAMPPRGEEPKLYGPESPDEEQPLTDHEMRVAKAYVYGVRAARAKTPYINPYFAGADEGKAYRSGYIDVRGSL